MTLLLGLGAGGADGSFGRIAEVDDLVGGALVTTEATGAATDHNLAMQSQRHGPIYYLNLLTSLSLSP